MISFGIDFGGVIVKRSHSIQDTDLLASEGEEVARIGVFKAVGELVSVCDGRVWIISKAGPRMQARTLTWLESVDFFSRTGLYMDHVRFCRKRHEKEPICRELQISHFVDDRIHVMQILRNTVPHLYLFGEPGEEKRCPPWAFFVSEWTQVTESVRSSEK